MFTFLEDGVFEKSNPYCILGTLECGCDVLFAFLEDGVFEKSTPYCILSTLGCECTVVSVV